MQSLRPAEVCKALLAALEAAEGRRRKRKRDQTPDAIGYPSSGLFWSRQFKTIQTLKHSKNGCWITPACATQESSGAVSAMARAVLEEWRLAHSLDDFRVWLEQGAPSDDARDEKPRERSSS